MGCSSFFSRWSGTALALFLFICPPVRSEDSPRANIEGQYRKSALATQLRFYDGCTSLRHPEFQLYSPEGERISPLLLRQRTIHIFRSAVSIKEDARVLSFRKIAADQMECEVTSKLEFTLVGEFLKSLILVEVETRHRDIWRLTAAGWKLFRTDVVRQSQSKKPLSLALPSHQIQC